MAFPVLNSRQIFGHVLGIEAPIAIGVFLVVVAGMVWAFVWSFLRRRKGAWEESDHPRWEGTGIALVAVTAVFLVTLSLDNNHQKDPPPAVRVQITAFQWCWRFSYEGTPVTVTDNCVDGHYPTLELPTGRVIQIDLESADVIHSWWVPYLRYKVFAYPAHVNTFEVSVPKAGTYPSRCAEFCGLYHYSMEFVVKAVAPGQFESWLHSQKGTVS